MGQTTKRIVLVDDDQGINVLHLNLIREIEPGAQVKEFNDPTKALAYFKGEDEDGQTGPDFLFLDINMPIMSGWELLEELKKLSQSFFEQTTIYMISSFPNPGDHLKINAETMINDWMEKPLTRELLLELLNNS